MTLSLYRHITMTPKLAVIGSTVSVGEESWNGLAGPRALGSFTVCGQVKQITSPGWMHETRARGWCPGKTQRYGLGREAGGGFRMGNTCKSMADSFQCMTKPTTIIKIKNKK